MGFDNVNDAATPAPENNEQLSVKISHGNEIRRVTLPQNSYSSLLEHTASLFGLSQANIILKYEDDDGDKISMSSGMELCEALRIAKSSQKILRLFVEMKALPKTESTPETPSSGIYLGPQGRFFPPPHPHSPGFSHPMPPPGFSPHAHAHASSHFGAPFTPSASYHACATPTTTTSEMPSSPAHAAPAYTQEAAQATPASTHAAPGYAQQPTYATHTYTRGATYAAPPGASSAQREERGWGRGGLYHGPVDHRHQHGRRNNSYFGPQSAWTTHSHYSGTWGDSSGFDKRAHKESMHMMKEQWREMKAEMKKNGNVTEEDKRKFRELKQEMRNDMRFARKDAMQGMKAMKLCDKKQRLVARHVEDVTIPDGTELPPNTPFIKTWKIRNEGPAWPTGSQLLFVSHKGDNLNGPERVVIKGEVLTGQEVEVSVPLITPSEPGRYVGYYRMVTPDNVKFGQRVWVSFVVKPSENV